MSFEKLLKYLVRHRNNDDLHSAMCYFESGDIVFICSRYDGSLQVIYRTREYEVDCSTVKEVLDLFNEDKLINYEI